MASQGRRSGDTRRRRLASAAVALASLGALAAGATPAFASYAGVANYPSGETGLLYQAEFFPSDFGLDNSVGISGTKGSQTITEYTPGMYLFTGPGCTRGFSKYQARCSSAGIDRFDMFLGDGNDAIAHNGIYVSVPAFLDGGNGHDVLNGGPRDDVLDGGDGNDLLRGNGGSDQLNGGPGNDAAWYNLETAPVTVTLDGVANDGVAGQADNADVENATGGSAGDDVTGDNGPNYLYGFAGDDVVRGRGGADILVGHDGDDRLWPGGGNDFLSGEAGHDVARYDDYTQPVKVTLNNVADDGSAGESGNVRDDIEEVIGGSAGDELSGNGGENWLSGDAGDDVVEGLGGQDRLVGNGGDDFLSALDGAVDRIWCGDGYDQVLADRQDVIEDGTDCEAVSQP
jgi:hypothetical protein